MPVPYLVRFAQTDPRSLEGIQDESAIGERIEKCWLVSRDIAAQRPTRLTEVKLETADDR